MSKIIIRDGDLVTKDPGDIKVYPFDWDSDNLAPGVTIPASSTWTITPVEPRWSRTKAYVVGDQVVVNGVLYTAAAASTGQLPPNATYWTVTAISLTKDQETILNAAAASVALQRTVTGDSRVTQLRLTGGTLGHLYEVANKVVTNETPAQTKERSFRVLIEQK